jgi:hypothetical protein
MSLACSIGNVFISTWCLCCTERRFSELLMLFCYISCGFIGGGCSVMLVVCLLQQDVLLLFFIVVCWRIRYSCV